MKRGRGTDGETVTGGRAATVRHVFGERVLSICMPKNKEHPKGWRWVALSDVAQMESGHTPSRNHPEYWGGDIPWISVKDARLAHGKKLSETEEYTNSLGIANSSARLLPAGTVCLSRGGTVGYVVILDRPMATSQGFANWICGPQLIPEFLQYLLLAEADALEKFSIGTTIKTIYYPDLKAFHVCLPPLAEQKRIVALLDEAFAGIDEAKVNTEASLQGAKSAYESYSDSIFSAQRPDWSVMRLGELCEFLNGFAFKSGDVVQKSQTQLVRMGNLYGNELDLNRSPVFYPNSFAKDYARYVLTEGDVIMSLTGTTGKRDYGFAVRIPSCQHALLLNQRIMKFGSIRQDSVDDTYFLHYLRSRCFLDILYPTAKGTRQANLSSVTMKSLPVPIPPLKEQETISEKISDMRAESIRLSDLFTIKLGKLSELKSSLLAQAFAGELTA